MCLVFSVALVQCHVFVFLNCFLFYFEGPYLTSLYSVLLPPLPFCQAHQVQPCFPHVCNLPVFFSVYLSRVNSCAGRWSICVSTVCSPCCSPSRASAYPPSCSGLLFSSLVSSSLDFVTFTLCFILQ